jgi:hypothetical protein
VLQTGVVLGDPDGIVRGDEGRRGRQLQSAGLRGDVGEQDGRVRRRGERRVVVLAGREDVQADLPAFLAISIVALIRSCSVGVRPVVGSVVTSPTVKIPNSIVSFSPTASAITGTKVVHSSTTLPVRLFPRPSERVGGSA